MKSVGLIMIFTVWLYGCKSTDKTTENNTDNIVIETALSDFKHSFPKGQLRDVYKSFYQDALGPGHILGDTASARNYLR